MNPTVHAITSAIQRLYSIKADVRLDRPDSKFGDYATNIAMQLAGRLSRKPHDIAEEIAEELKRTDYFADVTVAGPGFINFRLTDRSLVTSATQTVFQSLRGLRYVVEYSCPNAFKELHTGHLYQTIYGDILCRLLERAGARVTRTSFGGDVGLHVAKCLWGIVDTLGGEKPEALHSVEPTPFARARWISQCYVRGAKAYEDRADAKEVIDELNKTVYEFHRVNDHTSPMARLYWMTRQWSYDYFAAFYALIDVDAMRYYPESETAPAGLEIIRAQLAKGVLEESEGAVVFKGDPTQHLHTRVFITSKGLPTYETKDIGVIWLERRDYHFDRRIILTGNDQTEYMRVVFAAAETFDPSLTGTMYHLTNGTVRFSDGKKMSSRLGNVSRAVDVIDIVKSKVKELVSDPALVDDVALGAIKYIFAKYRLGGDIAFDVDETVSLVGNSGPYIQYAHARACSILSKSTATPLNLADISFDECERALMAKLGEYMDVVERSISEQLTHYICTYLYELAQEFNHFYETSRIIGDEREAIRRTIVELYRNTLADGLELLGVRAPQHM